MYNDSYKRSDTLEEIELEYYTEQLIENCHLLSRKIISGSEKIIMICTFDNELFKRKIKTISQPYIYNSIIQL